MAEGTYEYECMRAELLGVGKPDYEEFMQRKRDAEENRRLAAEAEEEAVEASNLEEAEFQGEALKSTTGKLDELNSILSATQKKLDRFKVRCGSVTELIKTKIGTTISGNGEAPVGEDAAATVASLDLTGPTEGDSETATDAVVATVPPGTSQRRSELSKAMDNHVDKLDLLLNKAERAEISLNNQNKQIRNYLK